MNKELHYKTIELSEDEFELLKKVFSSDTKIVKEWQDELNYIIEQAKDRDKLNKDLIREIELGVLILVGEVDIDGREKTMEEIKKFFKSYKNE